MKTRKGQRQKANNPSAAGKNPNIFPTTPHDFAVVNSLHLNALKTNSLDL
jgi:hypothetical protein